MSTLANNPGSLGAPNEFALVVARGDGIFLEKDDDVSQWTGKLICQRHLRELSEQYEHADFKHYIHGRGGNVRCGFPQPNHHRNAILPWGMVSFEQSKSLLRSEGFLLHPGTPLCQAHFDSLRAISSASTGAVGEDEGQCAVDLTDSEYTHQERKPPVSVNRVRKLFYDFARGAGVTRVECRKKFSELSPRGKRYRLHAANVLGETIIEMLAETEEEQDQLRAAIKAATVGRPPTIEDSKLIHDILTTAAEHFRTARNAQERVQLLSLYARDIPYRLMSEYVEGLSERIWNIAKKRAIDSASYTPPDNSKQRYDPVKLNFFVSFITSPYILVGLPWGSRTTKDSHGTSVDLPNMIMRTSTYETIRLYEKYMRDSGRSELILSNSTTYRILSRLPAMKSHAKSCIDYYEASASTALRDIELMLSELEKMTLLDHDEANGYKTSFLQIKEYLNGNFKFHAKLQSYYSDHCLTWGLSDPSNPFLIAPHSHAHQKRCADCKAMDEIIEKVNSSLVELKSEAKGAIKQKLSEFIVEYGYNVMKLYELKAHHARTVFTSLERERIIGSLEENQCFLTADFVQKWLPAYFRESQKMWFGKNGLSWHITHSLCNCSGKTVQHSFVHLLNEQDQNSTVVVELLNHTLSQLHKMGITAVHLRSDNAGSYHSSQTIASIPHLSTVTKVNVISWSFSEPQSGKSSSDRVAALVKRKMRNFIDMEHDVATVDEMLDAIIAEKQLNGISAYILTVEHKENSPTKIPKISHYGHFKFADSFPTAWRYYRIGQGVQLPNLKESKSSYAVGREGGKLASDEVNARDRKSLSEGTPTEFWFSPPEHNPKHHHIEHNDEDDEEATGRPLFHNPAAAHRESLYYCKDCGAFFIRHSNLLRHIDGGRHKVRPDRITLFDKTLGLFKRALEDMQHDLTLSPLNEAISTIRSGYEPPLDEGWALHVGRKGGRLPEKAKQLITDLFNARYKAHLKLREEEAWNNMRADPSIAPEDRMSREQIKNLINTLTQKTKPKKKTRGMRALPDEDEVEDDVEEGVFYEEVDVGEEDVFVTDDDMHSFIIKELENHFNEIYKPYFSDYNIGEVNFE